MVDITRNLLIPFVRHLRADANMYIRHLRKGDVAHEGAGAAFWFRPRSAALSQVPLDDREQALLFHARSADFQDVTIQATVNYRVVDPVLATSRIDFGVNPETGAWNAVPLETLGGLLTELAQQPAIERVALMTMRDALAIGIGPIREEIAAALAADSRLAERGIAVTDVRVVAVRTDGELERAMQTETREQIQQEADRATYERRAVAVERERAIAENELQNQIELAKREEQLVTQRGQNARREAEETAAAARILAASQADEAETVARGRAEATRMIGHAEAEAEAARLDAYRGLSQATLLGLVLKELAGNLPKVDTLVLTPDVISSALARFATGAPDGGERG